MQIYKSIGPMFKVGCMEKLSATNTKAPVASNASLSQNSVYSFKYSTRSPSESPNIRFSMR